MCSWKCKIAVLVPISPKISGKPFHWDMRKIDMCIAPLIVRLNLKGVLTINSCCGHGESKGSVILWDGKEINIEQAGALLAG